MVTSAELLELTKYLDNAPLPDFDELVKAILEALSAAEIQSVTLAKFSSESAQQAKLLRMLISAEFLDGHAKKQEGIQLPRPESTSKIEDDKNEVDERQTSAELPRFWAERNQIESPMFGALSDPFTHYVQPALTAEMLLLPSLTLDLLHAQVANEHLPNFVVHKHH